MDSKKLTSEIAPILLLRDMVIFPSMVVPLFVGREKSILAVENAMKNDSPIIFLAQKNPKIDNPKKEEFYHTGILANILQFIRLPDGTVKVLVEGKKRIVCKDIETKPFYQSSYEDLEDNNALDEEVAPLTKSILKEFDHYVKLSKNIPPEILNSVKAIDSPVLLADTLASHLPVSIKDKQELLETVSVLKRLEQIYLLIGKEIEALNTETRVRNRVKKQMEKSQREYYLNEQMRAIQKELGEIDNGKSEFDEIEEKIRKKNLSKEVRKKATAELKKLRMMAPMAAEATVLRNYLEWILDIPWKKRRNLKIDLKEAENVLEADHHGLEKIKERILEYLAVQKRVGKVPGQILCFVGPPGVGKTSLGKSIAQATNRKFHRIALGGVRDEAEIRGHRRTYIGSQPGKIIQAMRKAQVSNPLILLDEIDKLGADWRGDPTSALLEVLDPEQNATFADHYLEVDYDLSNVMFITTANTLNMPQPLLDRMEIIRLSGYTEEEKKSIALEYLIPRQKEKHGLESTEVLIDDKALSDIIYYYTQEAGVRNLEREIAKICRKAVKKLLDTQEKSLKITQESLKEYLGQKKYTHQITEKEKTTGVCTGLAWTQFGGEILKIESVLVPGKGAIKATGKLGEVMQESVQTAYSFIKSHYRELGIDPSVFEKNDIHVHVPEGATPKDGPSAGTAISTALASLLTRSPIMQGIAMTGEVTLRGHVLPIGGLKEKILAAHRAGVKEVFIPQDNEKDLDDIPQQIRKQISITLVKNATEVLNRVLLKPEKGIFTENMSKEKKELNIAQSTSH